MGNHASKGQNKEIERFTRPTGYVRCLASLPVWCPGHDSLYKSCPWDHKIVRKMIIDRKLAPLYPGRESADADSYECPICFMVCDLVSKRCASHLCCISITQARWIKAVAASSRFVQVDPWLNGKDVHCSARMCPSDETTKQKSLVRTERRCKMKLVTFSVAVPFATMTISLQILHRDPPKAYMLTAMNFY